MAAPIQLIKPKQAARAATSRQYGALVDALNQNITNLKSQNRQNLSDINNWYGDAATAAQAGTAADTTANSAAMDEHNHTVNALLAALGGNSQAAGMIGSQAVQAHDTLASLAANRTNEDHAMLANMTASEADAKKNQLNAGNTALQSLRSQLQSTIKERGAAYTDNLTNARQMQLQQAAELQNMRLAGKQFGINSKLANAQLNNMNAQTAGLVKQLKHPNGGGNGPGLNNVPWKRVSPADRQHMESSIGQAMYNPATGKPDKNPVQAWHMAVNAMIRANPKWNVMSHPHVRQWVASLWHGYILDYNNAHPGHKYQPAANGTPYGRYFWTHGGKRPTKPGSSHPPAKVPGSGGGGSRGHH